MLSGKPAGYYTQVVTAAPSLRVSADGGHAVVHSTLFFSSQENFLIYKLYYSIHLESKPKNEKALSVGARQDGC